MPRRFPLLLALLASLMLPAAASAQGVEPGLNVVNGIGASTEQIDQLAATGAKWSRHFVFQDDVDDRGLRNFGQIIDYAGQKGIKTLLVVARTDRRPPADPQGFADFMGRMAQMYKGRVEAYEVWNEQDEGKWWQPVPDAGAYLDLLRRSYSAVKQSDPAATVVLGPLTGPNYPFLEAMYKANNNRPLPADAVGVHTDTACLIDSPYYYLRDNETNRISRFYFLAIKELRETLLAKNDPKPLWITEIGWEVSNAQCGLPGKQKLQGVSPEDQAKFLTQGYHCLTTARDSQGNRYVENAMWFTDRDPGYGLFNNPLALRAFETYASRGDVLGSEPCGDFEAPEIEVLSPAPGSKFAYKASSVPIQIRTKGGDTRRITVDAEYNGGTGVVTRFGNPALVPDDFTSIPPIDYVAGKGCKDACSYDWPGYAGGERVPPGGVTLIVRAIDEPGNVGRVEVPISFVPPGLIPKSRPAFPTLKVAGKGRTRSFQVRIAPATPNGSAVKGGVFVEWQNRRKGKWKAIHFGGKVANRKDVNPVLTFKQRLKYGGKWRVRAVYKGRDPFLPVNSKWISFSA